MRARLANAIWEFRLGISTRGVQPIDVPDAKRCATSSYAEIMTVLRELDLRPSDVLVDLGCGKGRVVCCASRFQITEVIGLEVSSEISRIAKQNAARVRGRRAPITIENVRAEDFSYSRGNVFHLFDPFGEQTLRETLARLREIHRSKKRPMRFAYVNPVHEDVFAECDWLEMTNRLNSAKPGAHAVSFWRSDPLLAS